MPREQENSPQQEPMNHSSLNEAISDTYDELAAVEEETEEIVDEEVEVSEETSEEGAEELEATETEEAAEVEEEHELTAEEEIAEETPVFDEPAPERWPDEIKEVYNNLPPEARQAMLEGVYRPMQQQYTQSTTELAEMRKAVEPMLQDLQNYRADFERQGIDPMEAFRRQMAWASHLSRVGPEQGLRDMAAAYGLQNGVAGQQDENDEYLTPAERQMKQELADLKGLATNFQQQQQQQFESQQQETHQQRVAEVQGGLQSFINETNDGKPAHPHVEKVAPAMAGLIRGGVVSRVDDYGQQRPIRDVVAQAYDMACNLEPSLARAKTDTGQVKRAKAANRGVVTKVPVTQDTDIEAETIADSINRTYDELSRRRA